MQKLDIDKILKEISEKNDDERSKYINEKLTDIEIMINLLKKMSPNDPLATKYLGRLSEITLPDKLISVLLDNSESFWDSLFKFFQNPCFWDESFHNHLVILINLTIQEKNLQFIIEQLPISPTQLFFKVFPNKCFSLVPQFLLNLTRYEPFLVELKDNTNFQAIIPELVSSNFYYLNMLYNFLISDHTHQSVLNSSETITKLLYLISGPTDHLDEDETSKLHIDLQYLPLEKSIESDENKNVILSCLLLICSTKNGRYLMRSNGAYFILREIYKLETKRHLQKRIEDIIDILIKDEEEYNDYPDLRKVDIPEYLKEKFDMMDKDFLNNN